MQQFTQAQLATHITLLHQPTPQDPCPPELAVVLAAVAALPAGGSYVVLDDQEHTVPQYVYVLPTVPAAAWDGSALNSMGYGGVEVLQTSKGNGLMVYLGGSSLQSASTLWVVPAAAHEVATASY